jgi:hypothetical protein
LAVEQNVAASTQNQVLSAILFYTVKRCSNHSNSISMRLAPSGHATCQRC